MIRTYQYSYLGFTNQKCHCLIRILDEKDKPLVIVCAQKTLPNETSITNVAEYIYSDICQKLQETSPLKAKIAELTSVPLSKKLEYILNLSQKGVLSALLYLAKESAQLKERRTAIEERIKNMLWIEYYPSLLGTSSPYIMHVIFTTGEPQWHSTTLEKISEATKYSIDELTIHPTDTEAPNIQNLELLPGKITLEE